MLDKEFQYYLAHQNELLPLYNGKYIVVMGEKVVDAFSTESEAYFNSKKKYGLGNFLVQLCTPGDSAYTINYHSRARFV